MLMIFRLKPKSKKIWDEYGYLIDTHTAVACAVNEKLADGTKTVIASTANPFKFNGSVLEALVGKLDTDDEFAISDKLSEMTKAEVPVSLAELKTKTPKFDACCNKEDMKKRVNEFLA